MALGNREPSQISVDIDHFSRTGIRPVKGEVSDVDPQNRTITVSGKKMDYDILVLSPGVRFDYASVPGYENVQHFWDMNHAMDLRQKLKGFRSGKIVIGVTTQIYKCPPVPWEMAMMLDDYFRMRGLRDKISITVAHWAPKPMAMFGPVISEPVSKWLDEKNIETVNGFKVSEIDGKSRKLLGDGGESLDYDLAIVAPPHKSPEFISKNSDLVSKTGWLDSNVRNFRTAKFDDIYGLGDAISPSIGLGMAGVFAHFQADTVSSLVAGDVIGTYPPLKYNTVGLCASDTGDAGWIAYCDFGKKLTVPDTMFPDCRSMGRNSLLKLAHAIYEKYFLANVYGGWYA